ncbi:MAG: hypothetical protein AAF546_12620 [Verrucomicrobiota bacterium]
MKQILTCITAFMLTCSAFALIMGVKPYQIEVSKADDGSIKLDVINLRDFKSVETAGHWCYRTHKLTEGREVWYSNVVRLDFSEEFSAKEIEDVCAGFLKTKVYPSRIRQFKDRRLEVIADRYSPRAIWSPQKGELNQAR